METVHPTPGSEFSLAASGSHQLERIESVESEDSFVPAPAGKITRSLERIESDASEDSFVPCPVNSTEPAGNIPRRLERIDSGASEDSFVPSPAHVDSFDKKPEKPRVTSGQGLATYRHVSLGKPLGLVLTDRESGHGVEVEALQAGGAAEASAQVHSGDWLRAVNDLSVDELDVDEVLRIIAAACGTVKLTFTSDPGTASLQNSSPSSPNAAAVVTTIDSVAGGCSSDRETVGGEDRNCAADENNHLQTVTLSKPLGVVLSDRDDEEGGGVCVESMRDDGAAARSGLVQLGDLVMAVNGTDVSTWDVDRVLEVVGTPPGTVTMILGRAESSGTSPSVASPSKRPEGMTLTMTIAKPFGATLEDCDECGGVQIVELRSTSSPLLHIGDVFLRIGAIDVSTLCVSDVLDIIANEPTFVELVLLRP